MSVPYLYTLIEKDQLKEIIDSFQTCVDLPVQVIDEKGAILESSGPVSSFCNIFRKYLPAGETCEKLHISASKQAIELGETYIFSCHANLNHIVFPLINKGSFWGSILVGPFLMDEPDSLLIQDIDKKYPIPTADLIDLYEESSKIRVVPPATVTQISRLLYYLFSNLISESKQQLIINQKKLHQQSKINESIQKFKNVETSATNFYPYDKEKTLLLKVKEGNVKEAKGILNDLLGYVFFSGGSSLETLKSRAIELCSLLSRTAIEGGAATDSILKINNQFLKTLQEISDLDALCYKLQETVEVFTEAMFNFIPSKNYELMKRAMLFISENFSKNLSLDEVADYVHLNPSYFSSVFKQSCGSSFKEYLNMVRIEESKRLLANTEYSIIDIAIATGFEDQSYFSKVFKKYTGLTPKQYR